MLSWVLNAMHSTMATEQLQPSDVWQGRPIPPLSLLPGAAGTDQHPSLCSSAPFSLAGKGPEYVCKEPRESMVPGI